MAEPQCNHHGALVVVAAALVDRAGRVLMQQRPLSRQHGGLWEFPGGKLEPGEGPATALVRELIEELAIVVRPQDLVPLGFAASEGDAGGRPVVLLLYGCRTWQGQPVSQEGALCRWYDPACLDGVAMPPLDVPLARLLHSFAQV